MGAGPQTISGIVGVLNEVNSRKGVFKLFSEGTFTLDILERGDQSAPRAVAMQAEVDGRYVKIQLHTGGNPNTGIPVREGKQYPLAGSQTVNHLKFRTVRLLSTLALTSEVMNKGVTDAQAVYKVAANEIAAIMKNTRKRENMWALGDGSGLLATSHATTPYQAVGVTATFTVDSTAKLAVGMEIVPRHKTNGAALPYVGDLPTGWVSVQGDPIPMRIVSIVSATQFTAKYYDNTTVATGVADNAATIRSVGIYPWDAQGYATYGLDSFCTTGNPSAHGFNPNALPTDETGMLLGYGGVDRAVVTGYQANTTKDLANAALSVKDNLEPEEIELVSREPSLFNDDAIMVISPGRQFHQVVHNLEAGKRTYTRTKIKEGRWDVVRSGIFTFGWDPDCPAKTMFFFAPEWFFRMELKAWGFEDLGGSMYNQQTGGIGRPTGIWQLNAFAYKQLLCGSCRGNGKWINVGP